MGSKPLVLGLLARGSKVKGFDFIEWALQVASARGSARPRRFFLRALRGQAKVAVASLQSLRQVATSVREREYVATGRVFAHALR